MAVQFYNTFLKNTTDSGITISDLSGIYIPASGTRDITYLFPVHRLIASEDIDGYIANGEVVLNIEGYDLSIERAEIFLSAHDATYLQGIPIGAGGVKSKEDVGATASGTLVVQYDPNDEVIKLSEIDFLDLGDTPTTYSGYGGMSVTVVSGGTGLEFTDVSQLVTAAKVEAFYVASPGLSATTSLNFLTKVTLAISSSEPGFYEIIHSCLQSSDDSGIPYQTRLLIDGTIAVQQTLEELYNFAHGTAAWRLRSGTFVMELDGNAHTIDLDYATGKKNRVVYMKEAFISAKRLVIIE